MSISRKISLLAPVAFTACLLVWILSDFAHSYTVQAQSQSVASEAEATFTVSNDNDNGNGSLRAAIEAANAAPGLDLITFLPSFSTGPHTINLSSPLPAISGSLTITGPGANLLDIHRNSQSEFRILAIDNGATVVINGLTISGGNAGNGAGGGILNNGTLTLSKCQISDNIAAQGGGISNQTGASLRVEQSTVSNNSATGSETGGGVASVATFLISNSTISGNSATGSAGGNGGGLRVAAATIEQCTITNNSAAGPNSAGGLRVSNGAVALHNSIIAANVDNVSVPDLSSLNQTDITSGGFNLIGYLGTPLPGGFNDQRGLKGAPLDPKLYPLGYFGGPTPVHAMRLDSPAVDTGSLSPVSVDQRGVPRVFPLAGTGAATGNRSDIGAVELQGVIVQNANDDGDNSLRAAIAVAPPNSDIFFAPAVFNVPQTIVLTGGIIPINKSLNIIGPGRNLLTLSGNNANQIFRVVANVPSTTISDVTLTNGRAGQVGGAVVSDADLTMTRCAVLNSTSGSGFQGAGIYLASARGVFVDCTFSGNTGFGGTGPGGAIIAIRSDVTFSGCTISGNTSGAAAGAGIRFETSDSQENRLLKVVNTTISGNTVTGGSGAGISVQVFAGNARVEVTNSTITGNTGTGCGGLCVDNESANGSLSVTLRNSILANNTAGNIAAVASAGVTVVTSRGYNIASDNGGGFLIDPTDQTSVNPLLGPLQNNGGATLTHALLPGSPALDKGSNAGLRRDQRGRPRPFDNATISPAAGGDNSDIGAVEMGTAVVLNTNDTGIGSLRQAILDAPANGEISFDPALFNTPRTITLSSGEIVIGGSINITGPGANLLTISGNNLNRVFRVPANVPNTTISDLTVANGKSTTAGGAIASESNLNLIRCVVRNSSSSTSGGGVYVANSRAVFTESSFSLNTASAGGAIAFIGTNATISDSTINANSAPSGAGIRIDTNSSENRTIRVFNSTISGNVGGAVGSGSALRAVSSSSGPLTIELVSNTIVFNEGTDAGGIRISSINGNSNSTTTIRDSIIANNTAPNVSHDTSVIGTTPVITSLGYNLTNDSGGGFFSQPTDVRNADALLGPLQNNGGTTLTHALRPGSPALDKGNSSGSSADQRGFQRPFDLGNIAPSSGGDNSDIGAVEMAYLFVTNSNDAGPGSLRQAVRDAIEESEVIFDPIFFGSPRTIFLTSGQIIIDKSLTISGTGPAILTLSGNSTSRILRITANLARVIITDLTLADGEAQGAGAIATESNLLMARCNVVNNSGGPTGLGGAVFAAGRSVSFVDTTFSGNRAGGGGGAIYSTGGNLSLTGCTLSGNSAGNIGGAIQFDDFSSLSTRKLTITNSTVSGNTVTGIGLGGAIAIAAFAPGVSGDIVSSTIARNVGADVGGVRLDTFNASTGTIRLRNSIIANNTAPDIGGVLGGSGPGPLFQSQGFNLTSDNGGGFLNQPSDQINANPRLGPLQKNGGPTETHSLLAGSPALDKGHSTGSTVDQRGRTRPFQISTIAPAPGGDDADIGAVEMQAVIVTNANDTGTGSLRQVVRDAPFNAEVLFDSSFFNVARTIVVINEEILLTKPVTIFGPGVNLLTLSGNNTNRVLQNLAQNVSINDLTVSNGKSFVGGGGGILSFNDLNVSRCRIVNNSTLSGSGGGVLLSGSGAVLTLNLVDTTLSGNTASEFGGALDVHNGNAYISGSTFNSNTAAGGGGGISITGVLSAKVNIVNSTIVSNTSSNNSGGGINAFNEDGTLITEISNCTITSNTALSGGGVFTSTLGPGMSSTEFRNNIIAANSAPNVLNSGSATIASLGYNLLNDGGNGVFNRPGDQINTNAQLATLQDNGGPTFTRALLPGSPALDKGFSPVSRVDQRGQPRSFDRSELPPAQGGDNSDIGAVEMQSSIVVNSNDSGPGSLRQAVQNATDNSDIRFDSSFFSIPRSLTLTSGAIVIDRAVNIVGPGAKLLTISGNNQSRIFNIQTGGGTASLSGMSITGGQSTSGGGGAILAQTSLNLTDVAIFGNTAASHGGAIYLVNADGTFTRCSITGNTAGTAGGGIEFSTDVTHMLRINSSTISGNTAFGAGAGGGVFGIAFGGTQTLEIVSSTIVNNTATDGGGVRLGALAGATANATIRNSIVANNTTANLKTGQDPGGTAAIASLGFNIANDAGGGFLNQSGDQINTNPLVGPLSNNGGPTLTHALLDGSPALDKGNSSSLNTDQRGVTRPVDSAAIPNATGGDGADIGAFERAALAVVSAASFKANPLAQESIVAMFGSNLANATILAASTPLPTTLGTTTVQVVDSFGTTRSTPLFFVSPGQINAQITPGTAIGPAIVTVFKDGIAVSNTALDIVPVEPSLFTANSSGTGVPAAQLLRVNNGTAVYEDVFRFEGGQFVPAPLVFGPPTEQDFLVFYGTGIRKRGSLATVTLKVGDATMGVLFADPAPGFSGLDQVNSVALPRTLIREGLVTVTLTVDGRVTNSVLLNFL